MAELSVLIPQRKERCDGMISHSFFAEHHDVLNDAWPSLGATRRFQKIFNIPGFRTAQRHCVALFQNSRWI
jgi:hypothetical protein